MVTVALRALVEIAVGVALGAGIWVPVLMWALGDGSEGGDIARVVGTWPYVLTAAVLVVFAIGLPPPWRPH